MISKKIITCVVVGVALASFLLGTKYQQRNVQIQREPTLETKVSKLATSSLDQRTIQAFISDTLPQYQTVQSQIAADKISNVYPLSLPHAQGWVVEMRYDGSKKDVYLMTPTVQTKLSHPITSASGEDSNCTITNVFTAGNESVLGRRLADKEGYLILTGGDCQAYSGGNFTSVYRLSDGEKIKLSDVLGGNAQGIARGVFGLMQPSLLVDYGMFERAATPVERVDKTVIFDLQTGKLKQVIQYE